MAIKVRHWWLAGLLLRTVLVGLFCFSAITRIERLQLRGSCEARAINDLVWLVVGVWIYSILLDWEISLNSRRVTDRPIFSRLSQYPYAIVIGIVLMSFLAMTSLTTGCYTRESKVGRESGSAGGPPFDTTQTHP